MLLRTSSGAIANFLILGRLARVARIIRVMRVIRVMSFFRSFRILLTMVFGSMRNGSWAALLLFLIMLIYGIVFTQVTAETLIHASQPEQHSKLHEYYGNVPRAVLTLFQTITGGVDWYEAMEPLADTGWVYVVLFLSYQVFVQLAVMNVVTGLFLQSAIEQAQHDQEHVVQLRLRDKGDFVKRLSALFKELDCYHGGCISLAQFESRLADPKMQALFETFEIDNADAWTFFKLLDTDGGGTVDMDHFVEGCLRLKGFAKSIQMAQVMYHHKWIMDKLVDLSDEVHTQLGPLAANQKIMLSRMTHILEEHGTNKPQSAWPAEEKKPGFG